MGEWRNGRRDGLKIHCPQGHESSILSSPTRQEIASTPRFARRKIVRNSWRKNQLASLHFGKRKFLIMDEKKLKLVLIASILMFFGASFVEAQAVPKYPQDLYFGIKNSSVSMLQSDLSADSTVYPEKLVTGYFGFLTQKAVQRFQTKYGIVNSGTPSTTGYGRVGPKTRAKLNEVYGGGITSFGDYQWDDQALKVKYSGTSWNKIATNRLAGFDSTTITEKRTTEPCGNWQSGNYLRIEGGLCRVGFWLEDSTGTKIDSPQKLTSRFAPVENEAEAISFVAVTQGDLKVDINDIPEGHSLVIADAFLIQVVGKNTFGCGSHQPTGIIFKVARTGDIQRIAVEKEKPSSGPILCAD